MFFLNMMFNFLIVMCVIYLFIKKCIVIFVVAVLGIVAISDHVMAITHAFDLDAISVDTTPVFTIAVIVVTCLAAICAVHKVIGLIRAR